MEYRLRPFGTIDVGDIVVANLDGKVTLKTYYEEDDEKWLIPENSDFPPIRLSDYESIRIIGKVIRVIKGHTPRGRIKDAARSVREARKKMTKSRPSNRKIGEALKKVVDMIQHSRHWFAIYSVMYHNEIVCSYNNFNSLLKDIMQEEAPDLDLDDLRKMEVMSFEKPFPLWVENNAPVRGRRFMKYVDIAKTFSKALGY